MKRLFCVRAIQLAVLAALAIAVPSRDARGSEFGCFVICLYDDWECIAKTGHPADQCGYDSEHDVCNLGSCQLGPIVQ
jgi:hypothetical protein